MSARLVLVYLFRVLALVTGIPSLAATLYLGWAAVDLRLSHPGSLPPSSGTSNQAIALIETTARAAGGILLWLGSLGEWLVTIACVLSAAIFLFALLMWFTANGLSQGKVWARITAVFCGLVFLTIFGMIAAIRA
jgi:hypothetical protein